MELLTQLDKYAKALRRHGGDFAEYVERRDPKTQALPKHFVKVRDGNEETTYYFHTEDELRQFAEDNPDLGLYEDEEEEQTEQTEASAEGAETTARVSKKQLGNTRRATHVELHEHAVISELFKRLSRRGFDIDHYSAQEKPIYELVEGKGERATKIQIHSISEILQTIKEVGKQGIQIKRFKGLGEMNAKELFSTTMDPKNRKFLRVEVDDLAEAEEMFTRLMGEEVEPRRQFIQDNALNVRNLDV